MRLQLIAAITLVLASGLARAQGEINVLTDLNSPFPPGCIALSLPDAPASANNTLFDEEISAPSVGSQVRDSVVRVTIWRVGCHDPGFSIVMVRLQAVEFPASSFVMVPRVFADAGITDFPLHEGQLLPHPAISDAGASSEVITPEGRTYMLAVNPTTFNDPESFFLPEDYNGEFTMELFWGDFSPVAAPFGELFPLNAYDPDFDPPQFGAQILHGRMSGQYVFDGIPSTGFQLMVGEQSDDSNFIFAIFFTYLNGEPIWVVGTTGGEAPGIPAIELGMLRLTGGEFFGLGPGSFDNSDLVIEEVGSIFIDPLDCNTLLLGYDFSPIGGGTGVLEAERFIRIAGYDCNPWQE
ncbi:hypothetical protein [Wenzhouxiangella marina]|uniref:Uncharacterized protein n=1 Tax=Wenzhouxiangella marina TaxID=1579979 RepID=A0A0K0XTE2_9GAMM|nr:hypothetical protein [Wenzhouxiangella marina]AKS40892.1 hypothetical protein WM2015_510 [Wenzhouxiangella marina]MBB6087766.1 hypothetical protein [Wenzhouxiangella marina]